MGPGDSESTKSMDQIPYRAYTGSLNYFRMTRPDLDVASSTCSQFNCGWGPEHVHAVKQALRHAGLTGHWFCQKRQNTKGGLGHRSLGRRKPRRLPQHETFPNRVFRHSEWEPRFLQIQIAARRTGPIINRDRVPRSINGAQRGDLDQDHS